MIFRVRTAITLVSFSVIGLQITLMRLLALHHWSHFASMIISVALLGFGCCGTILTLTQGRLIKHRRLWLAIFCFLSAISIPLSCWTVQNIPLDIHYLAWNPVAEMRHILAIEFCILVPFLFMGAYLGLVLMDIPDVIPGHYAANLGGSGGGALIAVLLLYFLSIVQLLFFWAVVCLAAGLILVDRHRPAILLCGTTAGAAVLVLALIMPWSVSVSPYKKLALEQAKPDTNIVHTESGPLGRIDIVTGKTIHDAPPGMSLVNPHRIPPRSLVLVDGDQTNIVYDASDRTDYRFLDYTTSALPYYVSAPQRILLIGDGGGGSVALALQHGSREVSVIEPHRQKVRSILAALADQGGLLYKNDSITLHHELTRSYIGRARETFDLVSIPMLDGTTPSASGLTVSQGNYLFTVESFLELFGKLNANGMLCATVPAKVPPRDGLRIFNLAAEMLKKSGREPDTHLALIRSWQTVTVLISKSELTEHQRAAIRTFTDTRGFDLAYLPDLRPEETNRNHILPEPYYARGAEQLLGDSRHTFLRDYPFHLFSPTDNRPYFDNFMRLAKLPALVDQLKGSTPAFIEQGTLLLAVAFLQTALLSAVLIMAPLFSKYSLVSSSLRKSATLGYFFALGTGFMFLEMYYLQKMVLYLGDPVYSAATVIGAFLLFAGTGSWKSIAIQRSRTAVIVAGAVVAVLILFSPAVFAAVLIPSQSLPLLLRCLIVAFIIAPLAFCMGIMFPTGLRKIRISAEYLVPWAWGVNGVASVLAAAAAPILAMSFGFSVLLHISLLCYACATLFFLLLPGDMVIATGRQSGTH